MDPLLTLDSLMARFCRIYYFANLQSCILVPFLRMFQWYPFSDVEYLKFGSELKIYGLSLCFIFFKVRSSASLEETFVLPQPPYYGPGEIIPLNKEALDVFIGSSITKTSNKPEVRVLLLDVLWSSRCLNFQAVVASLSLKYTTPQIKFGRIDLDEDPSYENRFKVDASPTSLQLPTLILFVDGVEKARLPDARSDSNEHALSMWNRSEESVVYTFDLKKYYGDSASALD